MKNREKKEREKEKKIENNNDNLIIHDFPQPLFFTVTLNH